MSWGGFAELVAAAPIAILAGALAYGAITVLRRARELDDFPSLPTIDPPREG